MRPNHRTIKMSQVEQNEFPPDPTYAINLNIFYNKCSNHFR